jgi:hypothetical protein
MRRADIDRYTEGLIREVSAWPGISSYPARFGGTAFCFGTAQVGHVHHEGVVHIPFPRSVRDELLARGEAAEHPWAPNTGMASFNLRGEADLPHALWLMRLSYVRYALKQAEDPGAMLAAESERLRLTPRLQTLLAPFARPRGPKTPAAVDSVTSQTGQGHDQ